MKNSVATSFRSNVEFETSFCLHCGSSVPENRADQFCCEGCKAVDRLLRSHRLDEFYRIRNEAGSFRAPAAVKLISDQVGAKEPFAFLDDHDFRKEFEIHAEEPFIQFYLEGVHCTACLWLIEKLPEVLPDDLIGARLDLQTSIVDMRFQKHGSISKVAQYLDQMGYRPHPVFSSAQKKNITQNESRRALSRVALAGALTGNIMIFSVSIYAGATGFIKDHFDWITLGLSLPVFLYSAVPLYQSAWSAIRNQRWSVDVPIVIALFAGFITSVLSICFQDGSKNYLDSLTGLIFLLSGSRYFLMRLQKNAFEGMQFSESFYPIKILRNENEYVWVKDLIVGDQIEVPSGMRIPVDGIVVRGQGLIDEIIMTGESVPKKVMEHEAVYAGGVNTGPTLWIKVTATGDQTRIGKIAREIQSPEVNRTEVVKEADRVAKWFTISVLALSTGVLLYFTFLKAAPLEGIERVLSILIVSCPCAFAIATPLALIQAVQILLKRGVYLKKSSDLELVSEIQNVVFDKTGTLTEGVFQLETIEWKTSIPYEKQKKYLGVVRRLEQESRHPVAKALLRYFDVNGIPDISDDVSCRVEVPGFGVSGFWKGHTIEVQTKSEAKLNSVSAILLIDQQEACIFTFQDLIRKDAKSLVDKIRDRGLEVFMLSGDRSGPCLEVAEDLGIPPNQVFSEFSPELKANWIENHFQVLYVGDGANDGLALSKAHLGVAAHGALDVSMKAAGIYLTQNRLHGIADLFTVAAETKSILNRHLIFTIVYNASAITLASFGMLKPLVAAVLMPLSSVLILISTKWGTQKLRRLR